MAHAHVSSCGGGGVGSQGCLALAAHMEERERQVRANDESLLAEVQRAPVPFFGGNLTEN